MTQTNTPAPDYKHTLAQALSYLDAESVDVPVSLRLKVKRMTGKAGIKPLDEITARYNDDIIEALTTFFEGGSITAPRNAFRAAMVEAFNSAFDTGWSDGEGTLPIEENAVEWLQAQISAEAGNIDTLFQQAKELRKEEDFDFFTWATARADGYSATVLSIYNAARMLAQKNKIGIWRLGNTEKHCPSCAGLDGQSHRLSWYVANNYIPRKPGAAMKCGGYNCDCRVTDKKGDEITL